MVKRGRRDNPPPDNDGEEMPPNEPESSEDEDEEEEGGSRIFNVYVPPPPAPAYTLDPQSARTVISHIVNHNFKSYAGTVVLGPFHKSFTSIIGPNGSGKSNVIDAMLFVFGYRATKIRSKKVAVLLHSSEEHQNIRSATVTVHFRQIRDQPDGGMEILPGTEFYISRTANADNSSYYSINGSRCQFKEVAALLRKHGIDLVHNRFLILQGEVEQIAMMKPMGATENETGMLEYLEDIIGTTRYKRPLRKLSVKLNQFTEERLEKLRRAKVVEKEKEALRGPMKQAVHFMLMQNELSHIANKKHQHEIYKLNEEINSQLEGKTQIEEKISEIEDQITEIGNSSKAATERLEAAKKDLEEKKKSADKVKTKLSKAENARTRLNEEVTREKKKFTTLTNSLEKEQRKLQEIRKIPEKNQNQIEILEPKADELAETLKIDEAAVEIARSTLRTETEALSQQKNTLDNRLVDLNTKKGDAKAELDVANLELNAYVDTEKKEKNKLQMVETSLEQNVALLEEKKRRLDEIKRELRDSEKVVNQGKEERVKLKKDEEAVARDLHFKRSQADEQRTQFQAFHSSNRVLNFLMKKKTEGVLPGIYGRLGDLGGIDPMYDCAISTACGQLDFIVVDSVNTATACVEELKRHDVGRGSFIALDKQERWRDMCNRPIQTPENVPRLFDLIQLKDERFRTAFYYALTDTLVAKDLEQARRVAYGATRYRVVTIDGEIIEKSGTMSGGGREKRTGRMGRSATAVTTQSPSNLKQLEEDVACLKDKLDAIRQQINHIDQTESRLVPNIRAWPIEMKNLDMEIRALNQQKPDWEQQVLNQRKIVASVVPDPKRVDKLTKIVKTFASKYEAAAREAGELEEEVLKVTNEIEAITQSKMTGPVKKLEDTTTKLEKVKAEIIKLMAEIKSSERDLLKSEDKVKTTSREITRVEGNIEKASEELVEIDALLTKLKENYEESTAQVTELTSAVTQAREAMSDQTKELNELNALKAIEKQKLEKVDGRIKSLKDAIHQYKKKIKELKLHVIPEEEEQPLATYTDEELMAFDLKALNFQEVKLHEEVKIAKVDLSTVDAFREKDELYKERVKELEDVTERRNCVKNGVDEITQLRFTYFMSGFITINSKLKEVYQMITLGGDAEMDLVDSLDPFSEGIAFSVRPPGKSWKNISNLSGGEKTLSSLALVFALHYYKPSPLYVMDEIDAALDFKNVSIVGFYIKERTKNAQFIIISLRSNMFELAEILVGIFKTNFCTKSVTITPSRYGCDSDEHNNDQIIPNRT